MEKVVHQHGAAYYARKAEEHAATRTDAENAQRRENGRKPNVTGELPGDVVQMLVPTQKKTLYDA